MYIIKQNLHTHAPVHVHILCLAMQQVNPQNPTTLESLLPYICTDRRRIREVGNLQAKANRERNRKLYCALSSRRQHHGC